jgi:predicted amidohydrolase
MKISVAQIKPTKGDIAGNVMSHKKMIGLAIVHEADFIFFPELSLTGYEPELAKELAKNQDDKIFDGFQETSNDNNITIGIGVPTKVSSGIQISMLIFQPNSPRQAYAKQQLHPDEFPYFVSGVDKTGQLDDTQEGILIFDTETEKLIQKDFWGSIL